MFIFGIVAINDLDRAGESFSISGIDARELRGAHIRWNLNRPYDIESVIGVVADYTIVFTGDDIEAPDEYKVWEGSGKHPCVMVRATVFDAHIEKALRSRLPLYFAVEGTVLERENANLVKTKLHGLALTVHPAHQAYRVYFYED